MSDELFPGFEAGFVDTGEVRIRIRHAGAGPPLLLLHGHPQTHAMWHRVAPGLAEAFSVVVADLRGYGESSKPATTDDHEPYSKRAMARDMVAVMRHFGFERFAVAGHDRGGRVAYRLALDHPNSVARLTVLDIIPTGDAWRRADYDFGMRYFHWFFLAQPAPLPERLIGADPEAFYGRQGTDVFDPRALAAYRRAQADPETRQAMIEDYRAGATYDRALDEADREAGRRIRVPLLVLWSARNPVFERHDVLAIWREWADDVRGRAVDAGHYLAEEVPDEVLDELRRFFIGQSAG
jgi:haloacetate dehalogenase